MMVTRLPAASLYILGQPWVAQPLQALTGNVCFPLTGIHVGSCYFISPDHLLGGSFRGALFAPPEEGLDRFVSGFGEPVICYPVSHHG